MKRASLFVITGLLILLAQNALADTKKPSLPEIARLTKQIIKDNPQFPNPNLVYPGDKVRIVEEGRTMVYTVGKWAHDSKDGCLWQIANLHLQKKLEQIEVNADPKPEPGVMPEDAEVEIELNLTPSENNTAKAKVVSGEVEFEVEANFVPADTETAKVVPKPETLTNWQSHLLLLQVILAILTLLLMVHLIYFSKKIRADMAKNPDKYTPVIPEGLPKDPAKAFDLLALYYPRLLDPEDKITNNKHLQEISRGYLSRRFDDKEIEVQMAFEDGIRRVRIARGDSIHRATYSDGSVFYFRSCCGNMFVSDSQEPFQFPAGWSFVSEVTAEAETQTPEKGEK